MHLLAVSVAALAAAGGGAWAQSDDAANPEASANDDTIIVTARKRDERLQDIPDSLTVLTADTIARANITNVQELAQLTPNLVIVDQLRPGIQTVSLRGITTVQGGPPPFALVIDGVQQPSMDFLNQELVDVQQIEVLRGPQGTLYGAGAVAGAINIVTKRPTDEFSASGRFLYQSGDTKRATATVSGPLADGRASFRASVFYIDSDGVIDNLAREENVDFREEVVVRGSLFLEPTDNIDITLQGQYTDGESGGLALVLVTTEQFDDFSILPELDAANLDERELQSYSASVDIDLGQVLLRSITGYNKADQFFFGDGDFSGANTFAQTWLLDTEAFNQELRLSSIGDTRLRWVFGGYFLDRKNRNFTEYGVALPDNMVGSFSTSQDVAESTSWALFGQASYLITDGLDLTVGLRYDHDKLSVVDLFNGAANEDTFDELQPKASLSYDLTDSVMAYATYARGFRTGGFNETDSSADRIYENEVSDNYELGLKTEWLDGGLIANFAAFRIDFDNQQFFFSEVTSQGVFRNVINIPKTRVNGFEVELIAQASDDLKLHGTLGYNDTEITDLGRAPQFEGNRTPQVNGLTASAGIEYVRPVANNVDVVFRTDYTRRGNVFWDIANTVQTPGKNFVNVRFGFEGENWGLAFVGTNIFDEQAPGAVGTDVFGPGLHLRTISRTQRLGGELTVRF